jgi:hypothetical protein
MGFETFLAFTPVGIAAKDAIPQMFLFLIILM